MKFFIPSVAGSAVVAILISEATNKMNIPWETFDFNITLRSFIFKFVMKNIQKLNWRGQNCGISWPKHSPKIVWFWWNLVLRISTLRTKIASNFIEIGQFLVCGLVHLLYNRVDQGPRSLRKYAGAMGVPFFWVIFYCIFVQFRQMTHLVNLKMCRGLSRFWVSPTFCDIGR